MDRESPGPGVGIHGDGRLSAGGLSRHLVPSLPRIRRVVLNGAGVGMVAIISRPLDPARPARRWRFRLRTLLVAVLVVGLSLGWLARHLRREREQVALIAELKRA